MFWFGIERWDTTSPQKFTVAGTKKMPRPDSSQKLVFTVMSSSVIITMSNAVKLTLQSCKWKCRHLIWHFYFLCFSCHSRSRFDDDDDGAGSFRRAARLDTWSSTAATADGAAACSRMMVFFRSASVLCSICSTSPFRPPPSFVMA